jgi:SAM-dependent methyltransferase
VGALKTVFEWLPESTRSEIKRRRNDRRGIGQLKDNQALIAKRLAELEGERAKDDGQTAEVSDPRFPPLVRSRVCTQAQLEEPWFPKWCEVLGVPAVPHRKSWEFTYIPEVLETLGLLEPGHRGLGFGVGREPLVAAFATRGVEVLATDLEASAREAGGWARTGQLASSLESMMRPDICDPAKFKELVSWQPVDMRAIPADLAGFDFCWSACSLEHLGTLAAGLEFIERSVDTLRPGGIAVHTTEFNLSSDDETVESGPMVIYRKRDLIPLKERLEAAGHEVAAFDFSPGEGILDHYVDVPPYHEDGPTLRFLVGPYTLTSVAIVVRAGGA